MPLRSTWGEPFGGAMLFIRMGSSDEGYGGVSRPSQSSLHANKHPMGSMQEKQP